MYDPRSPRRHRLLSFLVLLAAFALGVQAERRGWLPRSPRQEPVEVRKTFEPFWETWWLVHEQYVDRDSIKDEKMTHGAILGMLASLGDMGHTTYLTRDEVKRLEEDLKGEFDGIGATMQMPKPGVPTILQTMPKSPARTAGLRPGDILLQVNGDNVQGLSLQQVVQRVKGPAGSTVHLKVLRGAPPHSVELDIQRAKIDLPDVAWQMLPDAPLAHVAILNFGQRTDERLREAIGQARQQGAKGLIVDVRGNPGGLKEQAVKVTSEFLKSGETVFIEKDAQGKTTEIPAHAGGVAQDIPLCVLINEGSASSAEIFAGAIQDHQRGKLIGERTIGTGTVLREFTLSDGSAVLLAVDQWLTPKERQIWHKGIEPDIKVELPARAEPLLLESGTKLSAKALADSKDAQLQKAMEILKKELK
jgi:carboxyl-terminal processing protease